MTVARELTLWHHRAFGKQGASFKSGAFLPPQDLSKELRELQTQIEIIKNELLNASQQADSNQQLMELVLREKEDYEVLAEQMA